MERMVEEITVKKCLRVSQKDKGPLESQKGYSFTMLKMI
jgi:hypothetical protein